MIRGLEKWRHSTWREGEQAWDNKGWSTGWNWWPHNANDQSMWTRHWKEVGSGVTNRTSFFLLL